VRHGFVSCGVAGSVQGTARPRRSKLKPAHYFTVAEGRFCPVVLEAEQRENALSKNLVIGALEHAGANDATHICRKKQRPATLTHDREQVLWGSRPQHQPTYDRERSMRRHQARRSDRPAAPIYKRCLRNMTTPAGRIEHPEALDEALTVFELA